MSYHVSYGGCVFANVYLVSANICIYLEVSFYLEQVHTSYNESFVCLWDRGSEKGPTAYFFKFCFLKGTYMYVLSYVLEISLSIMELQWAGRICNYKHILIARVHFEVPYWNMR